jgi:hypothetical protein
MKKLILCFLLIGSAHASEVAQEHFLNAMTVCPIKTNPLRALESLGGNSFSSIEMVDNTEAVTADVVFNPRLRNPMIGAPTRIVGKITVEMTYPAPGYGLVCRTKFAPLN